MSRFNRLELGAFRGLRQKERFRPSAHLHGAAQSCFRLLVEHIRALDVREEALDERGEVDPGVGRVAERGVAERGVAGAVATPDVRRGICKFVCVCYLANQKKNDTVSVPRRRACVPERSYTFPAASVGGSGGER